MQIIKLCTTVLGIISLATACASSPKEASFGERATPVVPTPVTTP
jgi:hypothetical protein